MNLKANPGRMAELERHCLEALALPGNSARRTWILPAAMKR
jgi:hypothetical protein